MMYKQIVYCYIFFFFFQNKSLEIRLFTIDTLIVNRFSYTFVINNDYYVSRSPVQLIWYYIIYTKPDILWLLYNLPYYLNSYGIWVFSNSDHLFSSIQCTHECKERRIQYLFMFVCTVIWLNYNNLLIKKGC